MIVRCSWTAFHRIRCINVKWFRKAFKKASFSTDICLLWHIDEFHSREKWPWCFIELKENACVKIEFNYLWPSCISAHQNGRRDVTSEQSTDKTIWSCSRWSNVPVKLTNYIKQRKTQGEETKQRGKYHGFLHYVKPTKLYSSVVRTFHGQITSHKCKILERLRLPMSNS